jgi:hypothetical protein
VRRVVAGILLAAIATLMATGAAAADETQTFAVGVAACDHAATDQLCTPVSATTVTTGGVLRVEFVASATHCSDVIAHILVDGVERFVSAPLPPGGSSGVQDLGPVTAGDHAIGVQGEGVVGGCNTGTTASWAGTLTVAISTEPAVTATPAPAAAPVVEARDTDLSPLLFGILGAGAGLAGGLAVCQVRKPRIALGPAVTPPGAGDAVRNLADTMSRELQELQGQLDRLYEEAVVDTASGSSLDSMSEMGETESLRLQMAMDRMSKMMSTLSNLLKKAAETASDITQNLK